MRRALAEHWRIATYGALRPGRRMAALALLGIVTGVGEAFVVILLVALAAGGHSNRLPGFVPRGTTWELAALALGATLVLAGTHFSSAWLSARSAADAQRSLQNTLLASFLAAPYAAQREMRTGELQTLMTGTRLIAMGTADAARAMGTAGNLLIVMVAAVIVDVRATAALLAAVALAVLIGRPLQERARRHARASVESISSVGAEVTETTALAADLRVFGAGDQARDRLAVDLDRSARLTEQIQLEMGAAPTLVRDVTLAAAVLGIAVLVAATDVPLAVLGATTILLMRALAHSQALSSSLHRLAERAANVERVEERLEQWRPVAPRGTRPCARVREIEATDVTFAHQPEGGDALRDVSIRLEPGEQLGIVGPTGAGKSTLAAILLGLLTPDRGGVLVDGVPLPEIDPDQWYRRTAWVPQDPRLLTGSVRDNIRFLRDGIDDEAIGRAAGAAALAHDLAGWRDGLDHHVGPAGGSLSGGQRQRIALARALAGGPDLVVLDEPTSALDAHAEAAVRETLQSLRGRATTVVIAHRLSTIRACDRVAVLRDGRLVALGPPAELAAGDTYLAEALALGEA